MISIDVTMTKNIWNVTFAMNTSGQSTFMTDYHACIECHDTLFGPFGLVDVLISQRAYEDILEVINDRTDKKGNDATINYYEAARIAYTEREYMKKFIEREINIEEINKRFRPLWNFTYRIVSGEAKERVRVVNKDPDNLLVSWVPGGMTLTEILKANMIAA